MGFRENQKCCDMTTGLFLESVYVSQLLNYMQKVFLWESILNHNMTFSMFRSSLFSNFMSSNGMVHQSRISYSLGIVSGGICHLSRPSLHLEMFHFYFGSSFAWLFIVDFVARNSSKMKLFLLLMFLCNQSLLRSRPYHASAAVIYCVNHNITAY